jgi:hypothetical protein
LRSRTPRKYREIETRCSIDRAEVSPEKSSGPIPLIPVLQITPGIRSSLYLSPDRTYGLRGVSWNHYFVKSRQRSQLLHARLIRIKSWLHTSSADYQSATQHVEPDSLGDRNTARFYAGSELLGKAGCREGYTSIYRWLQAECPSLQDLTWAWASWIARSRGLVYDPELRQEL